MKGVMIKLGRVTAVGGFSSSRCAVGISQVEGTEGALVAFSMTSIDIDNLTHFGIDVDEVSEALTGVMEALNAYFDSLKERTGGI